MDLVEIVNLKQPKEKRKLYCLYFIDKLLIAVMVAFLAAASLYYVQNQVEQSQTAADKQQAADAMTASRIMPFCEDVASAAEAMAEAMDQKDLAAMLQAYDDEYTAIVKLVHQRDMNKKAFDPYSEEIDDCKNAINSFSDLIEEINANGGIVGRYDSDLKTGQQELVDSAVILANKCSDTMYLVE